MVKSTACSSRGRRFDLQHPHGGSQSSLTPVAGHTLASDTLFWLPQVMYSRAVMAHTFNPSPWDQRPPRPAKAQIFNGEIMYDPSAVAQNCNPSTAKAKAELIQLSRPACFAYQVLGQPELYSETL